ncbi:KaiC 1, partial [bacterium]|nr:KaiC 1 [bacterium]
HAVSRKRISTGIPRLDGMMENKGYFRGSSILVSGTSGTGKSTVAAHFVHAACARGERCIFLAFEESPDQILRNMLSIGIDFKPWLEKGLLKITAMRASFYGLESHLINIHRMVDNFDPANMVIDPISNMALSESPLQVKSFLIRLVDFLKTKQITTLFTNLTHDGQALESTVMEVSSVMDTWLLLRDLESNGERNRVLYLLKSRGMAHSKQIREFQITDKGVDLIDVYTGPEGVLTGTARVAQQNREQAATSLRKEEIATKWRNLERKRRVLEAQIAVLQAEFEADKEETELMIQQNEEHEKVLRQNRAEMAALRNSNKVVVVGPGRKKTTVR